MVKKKMNTDRFENTRDTIIQSCRHWPAGVLKLALAGLLSMLAACATTTTGQPPTEDDIVVQRAKARWEALLSGDYETAYTYYSPGYRSTMSVVDFTIGQRLRRVAWTSAEYKEHNCEASVCKVKFNAGYKVNNPVPGVDVFEDVTVVENTWIKSDGAWWFVPKE